jgi:hypothetical protein
MSAIKNIYRELSNMTVGSVKARNIDRVKLAINQDDLPVRLLLPSTKGEMEFVAIGSTQKMTWAIRDLCLWAPLSSGKGVEQFAKSMVDYIDLYIQGVKSLRHPTNCSNVLGVEIQMGPIPWAETDYWAVDITVTIEEML